MKTTHNKNKITIHTVLEDNLFQEYCSVHNLKESSIHSYAIAIKAYIVSQEETIENLIEEADLEEEQRVRQRRKKVNKRLTKFKQDLQEHGYKNRTINNYLTKVRSFYSHFDINTKKLPHNKERKPSYEDIIRKEHIQIALQHCTSNKMKAILLFMASSGTSVHETSMLTIQDFINATSEYHHETRIENVIFSLEGRDDIVPTWSIRREKTDVPYYTFCTPEATQAILVYLKELLLRKGLKHSDKLFGIKKRGISTKYRRLNDDCGFGWIDTTHRFFHAHGMRKFFASSMLTEGVSELTVDFMEGRSVKKTHMAYFNLTPEQLKKRYINAMNCVTINSEIEYHDITNAEKKELMRYREKEKMIDEKLRNMEQLVQEYMRLSSS